MALHIGNLLSGYPSASGPAPCTHPATGKTLAPVYVQYQYIRLLHDRLRNRKALRIPREYFFTDFFDPGSRPTCSMIWLRYWLSFLFRIWYRYARFLSPLAFPRNAGSSMMIPTEESSSPASSPSRRPWSPRRLPSQVRRGTWRTPISRTRCIPWRHRPPLSCTRSRHLSAPRYPWSSSFDDHSKGNGNLAKVTCPVMENERSCNRNCNEKSYSWKHTSDNRYDNQHKIFMWIIRFFFIFTRHIRIIRTGFYHFRSIH